MATKKYFRTPVDAPKVTVTPSGEKEEAVWALRIDENGQEEFYIKGYTNVYDKIQAYLEDTKIENILAKCLDTGDMSYLEQVNKSYMDISNMPTNIFEANQKIKEAEEIFNNLPVEVRAKYNHNFNEYLADFGTENWIKNMNIETTKTDPVKETEKEKTEE